MVGVWVFFLVGGGRGGSSFVCLTFVRLFLKERRTPNGENLKGVC